MTLPTRFLSAFHFGFRIEYTKSDPKRALGQTPESVTGPCWIVQLSSAACGARKLPWYHPKPRRNACMSASTHSHRAPSGPAAKPTHVVCHVCIAAKTQGHRGIFTAAKRHMMTTVVYSITRQRNVTPKKNSSICSSKYWTDSSGTLT
jgi:hypothetical protein